jgi:hypothetical protein
LRSSAAPHTALEVYTVDTEPVLADTTESDLSSPPIESPTNDSKPTDDPSAVVTKDSDESDESDEDGQFRNILKEDFGLDTEKWKTDYDAVKSLVEAARMAGARNEDAEYGKRFREHESEFQTYLDSKKNGKPASEPAKPSGDPLPTYDQYQLLAAQAAAEGASDSVKKKFAEMQATVSRRMFEQAANPNAAMQDILKEIQEKAVSAVEQRLQEREEQNAIQQIVQRNSAWLYAEGDETKGFTPAGQEAAALYQQAVENGMRPKAATEMALQFVQSKLPNAVKPPRKSVIGSRRQANVAAPEKETQTYEKLFKAGKSLADVSREEFLKRQEAISA